jgi:hypothetical protein
MRYTDIVWAVRQNTQDRYNEERAKAYRERRWKNTQRKILIHLAIKHFNSIFKESA